MRARAAIALVVILATAGCAHTTVSDRLYCGRSIPGGGVVSDAELAAFVTEVVEPRFPDGFTIWGARGQWRGGAEESVIFEFVRPADANSARAVAEIAEAYRLRFRQEAVLRVTTPVRMQFVAQ